jgi:hypothetical protein
VGLKVDGSPELMNTGRSLLLLGLLNMAGLGMVVLLAKRRRQIVNWVHRSISWAESATKALEKFVAFAGGAVVAWWDVFKTSSWQAHPVENSYALAAAMWLVGIVYLLDWLRDRVKYEIAQKLIELASDRDRLRSERDRWVRLAKQTQKLIDRKIEALRKRTPFDYEVQIHTILKCLHEFFSFEIQQVSAGAKLRLALYAASADLSRLELMYSWNGHAQGCVREHPERMQLNSPKGLRSIVAHTYHRNGSNPVFTVPDCASDPDFEYFDADQKPYLRSMFALKYPASIDGTETALILTLDTDQVGFFSNERSGEVMTFILEMLRRLEFEFLNWTNAKQLTLAAPIPQ